MSVCIRGSAFRYQSKNHLHSGEDFWRIFEDGPWKWKSQGRYAGGSINPGHYFGLLRDGAKMEISHYVHQEPSLSDYELLVVQGELDNVLDLTQIENIQNVAKEMGYSGNNFMVLSDLISLDTGGNDTTDRFGYYAYRNGYNAALFFSARAIDPFHRKIIDNPDIDALSASYAVIDMRQQPIGVCLVVFSGMTLLRSIKRYSFGTGEWEDNPYWNQSEEVLNALFEYKRDYQETMEHQSFRYRIPHTGEA
jgi:hypothetical protein